MQRVVLRDVDRTSFEAVVGSANCADGAEAVRRRAVLQMFWDASQQLLTGTVREQTGEIRSVSASFRASHSFPLRFRAGTCSCAAAVDCVHVAALVLAAIDDTLLADVTRTESGQAKAARAAARRRSALPWEQSLDTLLAAPEAGTAGQDDGAAAGQAPLA